jgi:hypothetical protein
MRHHPANLAGLICSQQASNLVPASAVGCFKLSAGRAMSLSPNAPGELRIAHGKVWVTFGDGAQDETRKGVRSGDHFLGAGDLLRLLQGQRLVMEAYEENTPHNARQSVYFSWEPDAILNHEESPRWVQQAHAEVRQPLLDLVAALHQAGWAFGRLLQGLAGHALGALTFGRSMP